MRKHIFHIPLIRNMFHGFIISKFYASSEEKNTMRDCSRYSPKVFWLVNITLKGISKTRCIVTKLCLYCDAVDGIKLCPKHVYGTRRDITTSSVDLRLQQPLK